jgi:outer membrane scaffolding protein for murein synthesis (MipA/OmpV family)
MKITMQTLLALGFVGAMTLSTTPATKAQGVSIYGPGYEVDVGSTRRYDRRYYRDYENSYGYAPRRQYYGNGMFRDSSGGVRRALQFVSRA